MAKPASTAVATTQPRAIDAFKAQITLAMPTLQHLIPQHVGPDKFKAMIVTAVAYDKNLLECSTESLIRETAQAAELGLSLNKSLREADILTVWNGKLGRKEAQMRPRYMGLMKLARQSGEIKDIYAHVVHEGDFFEYELGIHKDLRHRPGGDGPVTHAYVVWTLKDGTKAFEVLDRKRLDAIRDRSEGYTAYKAGKIKSTPWVTDEEEMQRKTAVRAGSKYMPISSETWAKAVAIDDRGDSSDSDDYHGTFTDVPVDVTESPAPSASAAQQTDALADKLAPKVAIPRIDVPKGFDDEPDYFAWATAAADATSKLDATGKKAFRAAHADILKQAPQEVIEQVGV